MPLGPIPDLGSTFGSYRIDAVLGRGGMGIVYRAEDLRLGRNVALKLVASELSEDQQFRERFLSESRLAASTEHAGIVPVYEAGEVGGRLYIAMRYIEGRDLGALLRQEGPLEPVRAVTLVAQLADALQAAHAHGLIHRDVKPSNALVGASGSTEQVFLTDFGITEDVGSQGKLTDSGKLVGTVDYMAPERIRGEAVDGRADVYSLGCVLFECLTGQVPFARPSDVASGRRPVPPPGRGCDARASAAPDPARCRSRRRAGRARFDRRPAPRPAGRPGRARA